MLESSPNTSVIGTRVSINEKEDSNDSLKSEFEQAIEMK